MMGPTEHNKSVRQRQDDAMQDPFNYGPKNIPTVTGKTEAEANNAGLKEDIRRFLNP